MRTTLSAPGSAWWLSMGNRPRLRNIPLIARLVLTTKEERLWECYVSCHGEAMTASPGISRNFKWATSRPPLLFAKPSASSRKSLGDDHLHSAGTYHAGLDRLSARHLTYGMAALSAIFQGFIVC